MTLLDLALCSSCCVAMGYWLPPARVCPACAAQAAAEREADR